MPAAKSHATFFQRIEAALGVVILPQPPLGSGGFATVYAGELVADRRPCAVKIPNTPFNPTDGAGQKELEVMQKWKGLVGNLPNNLTLLAGPQPVLDDNRQPRYVAAWELASGTLLDHQQANFPNGMPRDALFSYMEDAAKGLDDYFLIDADPLVHRDFKPENLFLFGHRLKIGDPALMRSVGASFSMTGQIQGTLEYMPHEAMVDGTVSSTFDRYSFIVTYANLRLGRCVFSQGLPAGMLQRIEGIVKRKRELRIDLTGLDPDERELFGQLAHPDYKQRPLDKLTDLLRALGPHAKAAYAAPPAPADQTGGGAHRRVSRGFEGRQQQMPPTPLVEPFTQQQALASRKHWAVHLGIEPEFTVLNDMRFVLLPPA